jgi:hypothetical protein
MSIIPFPTLGLFGTNSDLLVSRSLGLLGARKTRRLGLFKKPNIRFITESTIPLLASDLVEYALLSKLLNQLVGRRIARAGNGPDLFNRYDRTLIEVLQNTVAVSGRPAEVLGDQGPVSFSELQDAPRRLCSLGAHLSDPTEKEGQPSFPIARITNGLKVVIIGLTVAFEIIREIKNRLLQDSSLAQKKRDEQTAYPAIAVQEGVDRLELDMGQADLDQERHIVILVQELLEFAKRLRHFFGRRRDEGRFGQRTAGRSDPILAAP